MLRPALSGPFILAITKHHSSQLRIPRGDGLRGYAVGFITLKGGLT